MKRVFLRSIAAAVASACIASGAVAQTKAPASLLAAAQKEGEVVWYETSPPEVGDKIRASFEAQFPGIRLKHVSVPNIEQMSARILQEVRTNAPTGDVVQIGPDQILGLKNRGILHPVEWEKLGVDKRFFTDPHAVSTSATVAVLMTNTKLVTEAQRPKTWDDLLKPEWKGKISAWGNPYVFVLMSGAWGDAPTRAYLEKFAAQQPVLAPAPAATIQSVVSGDLPIGVGLYHIAMHSVKAGAPIALHSLDIAPVAINLSGVIAAGKNRNAGQLLVWWLTTPEGAKAYEAATNRGNIYVPETESAQVIKGMKVSTVPFERADTISTLLPIYQKLQRGEK